MEYFSSQFMLTHAAEIRFAFALVAIALSFGLIKTVMLLDRWIGMFSENLRRTPVTAKLEAAPTR